MQSSCDSLHVINLASDVVPITVVHACYYLVGQYTDKTLKFKEKPIMC